LIVIHAGKLLKKKKKSTLILLAFSAMTSLANTSVQAASYDAKGMSDTLSMNN